MVKLTQIIRRQFADELFGVFYHFVGLTLKRVKKAFKGLEMNLSNLSWVNFYSNSLQMLTSKAKLQSS